MKVKVKKAGKKGKGLFAARDFKKSEIIVNHDFTKLKRYTLKEISGHPKLNRTSDHSAYIGHGKYVVDMCPISHINHSCNPSAYSEYKRLGRETIIALRPIKKGEEITIDAALEAVDQIRGAYPNYDIYHWKMKCHCGSRNCRKIIHGDFFRMPKRFQKEKMKYLPTFIKRKYRKRLSKLR